MAKKSPPQVHRISPRQAVLLPVIFEEEIEENLRVRMFNTAIEKI